MTPRFLFETPPGFAFNSQNILKIWFGSIISEQSEMIMDQDKRKVVLGYLSWFRDPVRFCDTHEGSSWKRKDKHTIKQLEKELDKDKDTISRQGSSPNMKKSLVGVRRCGEVIEPCGRKLVQLEEELDNMFHFFQQIKKEQNFEISWLKRDLVIYEEVVHYQKGEI